MKSTEKVGLKLPNLKKTPGVGFEPTRPKRHRLSRLDIYIVWFTLVFKVCELQLRNDLPCELMAYFREL
jgi:hypothetical protein